MEAKEILEKVKLFFNDLVAPAAPVAAAEPPAPAAPTEYELKGGGKVTIDKLEEGGIVVIDGNPALPGELELADGTKITVADNGAITMVTPAAGAPVAPEMEMGAKFAAFETSTNEKFAAYETKFAEQEAQLTKMSSQLGKATKVIEKLMELSTLIVEAPAAPADPSVQVGAKFGKQPDEIKKKEYPILFN